jgi:hypothetical protein
MSVTQDLIAELGYTSSPHYKTDVRMFEPDMALIFRSVSDLGIEGIYVFQSSPNMAGKTLSDSPLVYIAEAKDVEQAKVIHRSIWNLGKAPFLIIVLPNEVRVYTGFDYTPMRNRERGLLETVPLNISISLIRQALEAFTVYAIDSGRIWAYSKYTDALDSRRRVDVRLLKNLQDLDQALTTVGSLLLQRELHKRLQTALRP